MLQKMYFFKKKEEIFCLHIKKLMADVFDEGQRDYITIYIPYVR